jgi:hypothetical protein
MRGAPNDLSSTTLRPLGPSVAYCEALAVAAVRRAELPEFDANLSDLAVRAEKTDFKFITRKGESG